MILDELRHPIVQAPMAGGASTPELVAAVSGAGGLGFLAAGYRIPRDVRDQIHAVRELTDKPFGVNIFVPDTSTVDGPALAGYRDRLAREARRYGVALGEAVDEDDGWIGKLAVVREERVPVVSFTFGCPDSFVIAELQEAGCTVVITVTSATEASKAVAAGADALCVQGAEAGAHRGTFRNADPIDDTALLPLLRKVTGLSLISMSSTSDASEPEMDGALSRLVGKVTPLVVATANGLATKEHGGVKPVPEENDADSDSTIGAAKEDAAPEHPVASPVEVSPHEKGIPSGSTYSASRKGKGLLNPPQQNLQKRPKNGSHGQSHVSLGAPRNTLALLSS